MDRLALAKRLVASGLSIIPIRNDGTKAPAVKWKEFQSSIANPDDIIRWFGPGSQYGIAIVTGAVSGNLEVQNS
jgi:putative DNA primase/helicase